MKNKILIIAFFLSINSYSQDLCNTDIMNGEKLLPNNEFEKFSHYDFSKLWLVTDNNLVFGVFDNNFLRLQIKLINISRNINNSNEYDVYGKSKIYDRIVEFVGKITILKIQESERVQYGVDDEFKRAGIKTQGLLTAKFEFIEDNMISHWGNFTGNLESKWFVDKEDKIQYDDINMHSDGYFNNAFVGTFTMNNPKVETKCQWGDYRIPNIDCRFDVGTAEFNITRKYWKKGWKDVALKNKISNQNIIETKEAKIIKNWWE